MALSKRARQQVQKDWISGALPMTRGVRDITEYARTLPGSPSFADVKELLEDYPTSGPSAAQTSSASRKRGPSYSEGQTQAKRQRDGSVTSDKFDASTLSDPDPAGSSTPQPPRPSLREQLAGLGSPVRSVGNTSRPGSTISSVVDPVENRYFEQAIGKAAESQATIQSLRQLLEHEKEARGTAEQKVKELETAAESRDTTVLDLQRQHSEAQSDYTLRENQYKVQLSQKEQALTNKDSVFSIERGSWNKTKKELEEKLQGHVSDKVDAKLKTMCHRFPPVLR
ncbi:hypothetical protein BJ508DRAFT_327575 [Ascobolus immersus RN42]|uniref:Uncharacterized protein n=1 Tax=Ascobolus immersus RN42 TaxID=1160509 RepID=A0A3N4I479_ASCIM|nr:hypothetical protein BJ508DRAFT_327575 [Ascobolus immersus RN42]